MKQHNRAIFLIAILFFSNIAHPTKSTPHSTSIDSLWQQVQKHYKSSPELALAYAEQLQKEAKKHGSIEQEANALWSIGYINYGLGNFNESVEGYFEVLPLYRKLNNKEYLAKAYFNIGIIFTDIENDRAAEIFYKNALPLYLLLNNQKRITSINLHLGRGYVKLNEYKKAEKHLNIALIQAKEHRKKLVRKTYNWLGELERKKGNTELAIGYFKKTIELCRTESIKADKAKSLRIDKTRTIAFLNLGLAYFQADDLSKAKEYAEKSLVLSKSIENLDKQIKPQILLADIALKERGENKEEVMALISSMEPFSPNILNQYLIEALDYVSSATHQKLLTSEEKTMVIRQYAPQTKLAYDLLEKTEILLQQHSVQMSIDKIKEKRKVTALEERDEVKTWTIALLAILFVGIVVLLVKLNKFKKLKHKKVYSTQLDEHVTQFEKMKEKLSEANDSLRAVKKVMKEKEEENIEKALIIDLKDTEFKEVDDENTALLRQDVKNHEIMSAMEDKLLENHDLMHKMNKYIWDVIIELQHKGYDVPPPLWDLRGDRDN